ncbi:hypothetical protein SUGI_0115610 [Cryptomeria japonica]|nr:hypothetical protein SUGI_0115600 [Cryptomeria japonica]GLJ09771.1 hypothetical protein SUGI_0115610 [Cryptomeria japonica]
MMMEQRDKGKSAMVSATKNGSSRQTFSDCLIKFSACNLATVKSNAALLGFKGNPSNTLYGHLASHPRAYPFRSSKHRSLKKPDCVSEEISPSNPRSPNRPERKNYRPPLVPRHKWRWEPVLLLIPE